MQLKKIKSYMMPLSMLIGVLCYSFFEKLSFITPWLIFFMLLITYANIILRNVKLTKLHFWLLVIQLLGSVSVYLVLSRFDIIIAQSVMICILAPTATSAVVITGMLGGNTASLTAFSLLSNLMVAIFAPFIFIMIGDNMDVSFVDEFIFISKRVCTLLISPFVLMVVLNRFLPTLHRKIRSVQSLSFYLWNIALIIVTARTVSFLLKEGSSHLLSTLIVVCLTLIVCLLQFYIGRKLGRSYEDTIAGGQGLGQKNTILAIWMAQTYMNPLSSIGPGFYILWQNIVNSLQVWKMRNRNVDQ